MRRRALLRIGIAAAVVVASAATVLAAPSSFADVTPSAPYTAFTLDSVLGNYLDSDGGFADDSDNSNLTVSVSANQIAFENYDTGGSHVVVIGDPPSGPLGVGTYEFDNVPTDPTHALMTISVDGRGCSGNRWGFLTISELTRDVDTQLITSMAALYEYDCDNSPALGALRYNSSTPYKAAKANPAQVNFADIDYGTVTAPTTVTVTGRGPTPVKLGAPIIGGANAGSFEITSDTCNRVTLAFAETCTVGVREHGDKSGPLTANLMIPDDTFLGQRNIGLSGSVGPGPHLVVSPASLDFGSAPTGTPTTPKQLTITSDGAHPAKIGSIFVGSGPDPLAFTINDTVGHCVGKVLDVGQSCAVSVTAIAAATGTSYNANLVIASPTQTAIEVAMSVTGGTGVEGTFYPVPPKRIMDTRIGLGAPKKRIGPNGVVHLKVTGVGGLPATGVRAVVLNVTVTAPTVGGYVSVYPTGTTRPNASSLNFVMGWTGANSVTVGVGTNGQIDLFNLSGNTHVIVDIMGFYAGSNAVIATHGLGGQFQPFPPARVLDTRTSHQPLPPGWYRTIPLDFDPFNSNIRAFAVNITAANPQGNGYLKAWNGDENHVPSTSTVNFTTGKTVPNFAIVPASPCPSSYGCHNNEPMIAILNIASGSVDVVVDIVGVFDDGTIDGGLRFSAIQPTRIVDTRIGQGGSTRLGTGATARITAPNTVAGPDTMALMTNVTAIKPSAATYLTIWPQVAGEPPPTASNLNPAQGQTVPNAACILLGEGNQFNIFNFAGSVDVAVDVVGHFESGATYATFGLKPTFNRAPTQRPNAPQPTPLQGHMAALGRGSPPATAKLITMIRGSCRS